MQIEPTLSIMMGSSASRHEPKPGAPAKDRMPARQIAGDVAVGNTDDSRQTELALRELSQAFKPFNITLKFFKDTETGVIVIEMINQESGETLKQIPNDASLHLSATLAKLQGQLFNGKA